MKTKINIQGMHCVSCEILLEKELKKIPGFKRCSVSHKTGEAQIQFKKNIPEDQIEEAISACGYQIASNSDTPTSHTEKNSGIDYFMMIIILIVIAVLFLIFKELEISRFFPSVGENVGIVVALLLGVVASLSTCLALTGGIVMGFGSMVDVHEDKKHHFWPRTIPHLYFHFGRIGGFAFLGGLLGLVGSKINYSLSFTGYLSIVIAILMFYIGLQILNIVPSITKLGFHLPKSLSNMLHKLDGNDHHFAPMIIGVLTFLLPCGFTQSMQLASVASGSFVQGALIMGAFAIGTMPILLSIGVGSTYAKQGKTKLITQFIGIFILLFSIYSFNSGLVLSGSSFTLSSLGGSGNALISDTTNDGVQVVKMDVDWTFSPTEFKVKAGIPVRWEINGINLSGCSNKVVIPSMDIKKNLTKGLNVVEFTPQTTGTIPFSCWMGMINGKFIVTE